MKTNKTLLIASIMVAATFSLGHWAKAELVSQEVEDQLVTPEAKDNSVVEESDDGQEVIIIKKKKKPAPVVVKKQRRVIIREVEDDAPLTAAPAPVAMAPAQIAPNVGMVNSTNVAVNANAQAALPAPEPKKSVGAALDQGIQAKMDGVKDQFEQAMIRTLDKIKITVDDGGNQNQAIAQTTIVNDNLVAKTGAPVAGDTYIPVDKAPVIADGDNKSVGEVAPEKSANRIRIAPVFGMTNLSSDYYQINGKYTAGVEMEIEMDNSMSATLGYTYSQYDVSLANSNPFFGFFGQGFNNSMLPLQYNQNVFTGGLRYYLMPKQSKLRIFLGGGAGYNKGYLNYQTPKFNTFNAYPNSPNVSDYEVSSFLGILEAGIDLQLTKSLSLGGQVKYAKVLSAKDNQPLNNYAFFNNGQNRQYTSDQQVAGGSIANESFYSILAALKLSL